MDKKGHIFGYFRVPVEILPTVDPGTKLYDMVVISRSRHGHSHEEIRAVKEKLEPGQKPPTLYSDKRAEHEKPWSEKSLEDYDDDNEIITKENFFPGNC
jgi:hypothetical protein